MSQITRCPSCATKFKVVADQLRISDGWVRCGQCKEVFDASAHLLPSEPQALLPDVSMTASRPPPTPVVRATSAVRAWGAPSADTPAAPSALGVPPAKAHDLSWDHPLPDSVLDVPVQAVPSFLVAGKATFSFPGQEMTLQPTAPFAWRSVVPPAGTALADGAMPGADPLVPVADAVPPLVPLHKGHSSENASPALQMGESLPGYELPYDEFREEWPEDERAGDSSTAGAALYPPLELPRKQSLIEPERGGDFVDEHEISHTQKDSPGRGSDTSFDESLSPESLSRDGMGQTENLQDGAVGVIPRAQDEDDSPEGTSGADEVSFVRAAKRKAFWRRPLVRTGLGVIAMVLLCTLALQMVLQERDRIAAMDVRVRPWLQRLCEPLQCTLAPLRQISDVVIESSSFNKARGDSYQLVFVIKNRATLPLSMPAMELTLTDTQDQPVLRRVFLPQEMGAPAELPALGEWTSSVAVVVTTGGARVAGYRLLAFYP